MLSAKARILIFSSSYPPVVGGVQTVAHNLAKQLIASGHEVHVVTNRYPVTLPANENVDGIAVERLLLLRPQADQLRRKRPDLFLASLYFGPENYRRLKNIFKQFRPDVVNVHFPDHQIAPVLKLRKQFKFRLVVSLHGHDVEQFFNGYRPADSAWQNGLRNLQAILECADAVTAVSKDLLNKAIQIEPTINGKSHVIYNGVDHTRFQRKEFYRHPRPYFLALGRLTRSKGFDILIDAFAQHKSQNQPDLIIAGDGVEREALQARVTRLGLNEKVFFCGEVARDDAERLLNGCLSLIVPSRSESFGITALEAMAAGKPVIATRVGGLPEVLAQADALHVPSGDPLELVGAVSRMLRIIRNDPAFGARNHELAKSFGIQNMTDRYLQAFQK